MSYTKAFLTLVGLLSFGMAALAQRFEVGAHAGGSSYMGDLNQYNPVKISGIEAGAFVKLNFNPHLALGLHYNYGKVKGNDASSNNEQFRQRNLSFFTPLNEFSLLVDFNFFDMFAYNGRRRFTPFLFGGVGTVLFEPKANYEGETYKLRLYYTEGQPKAYKKYALTFPIGAGTKYKLNDSWTLFTQVGFRIPLTDYIDDVSGLYPDPNVWTRNQGLSRALSDRSGEKTGIYIGEPGTQRGDFRKRDSYMFVGIGISYTFVSQKCFTF
ncbi:DUF6089 family protein [Pedobacter sp. ASV12]|uniref:type IX secretion system protein PorG n=1 Tax=Pedobacter sp. ASV12 TaxID=2795120 RepID=UPI0018ED98B9|nr:DUF6089 family protein [Pedobacter sp. ASV12]